MNQDNNLNQPMYTDGLILVNKPTGMTSFDVTRIVGKSIHIKKVGHSGTLDKDASGLMLVCFGKATKLLTYLIGQNKRYIGDVTFGSNTTTDDATGEVISVYEGQIDQNIVKNTLSSFIGKSLQVPPKYSSLHVDGKRAYQLASTNQDFEIQPREIEISDLKIEQKSEKVYTIDVSCSSGTYIRAIARDAGIKTGYLAHLSALKRMSIGNFSLDDGYTIEQIKSSQFDILSPIQIVTKLNYPILTIKSEWIKYFRDGKKLCDELFDKPIANGINCVISENEFMGIIEKKEETKFKFVY